MKGIVLHVLVFFALLFQGIRETHGKSSACNLRSESCSECIQDPGCTWCSDWEIAREERCQSIPENKQCLLPESPRSEEVKTEQSNSDPSSPVNPFFSSVKLRPWVPLNISFTYTDKENRPLDLYILMDLSCTMAKHKETIVKLATKLAIDLKNLTSNLRIGFGSFVDKPVLPFSLDRAGGNSGCRNTVYKLPHSFKNHLSLTSDITKFQKVVNSSEILASIDEPEATLDGLMQAVVCKNELGWRYGNKTRRVIVLATDGPFHIAGDGKLGGIILPHDGECSLENQTYSKATILDYPSPFHVAQKIRENNIYVIFAVTEKVRNLYEKLSHQIGKAFSSVRMIADDESVQANSRNSITTVVVEEYRKIMSSVSFHESTGSKINVVYYSKCKESSPYARASTCTELKPNDTVDVKAEITLTECGSIYNDSLEIFPSTFNPGDDSGYLRIIVDKLCNCECENEETQTNSTCSFNGYQQCGICNCLKGFSGPSCDCNATDSKSLEINCLKNGTLCSAKGNCICGQCECNEGFVGSYCECSTENCKLDSSKDNKGLCNSGKEKEKQGNKCSCGGCTCSSHWEGKGCQCTKSSETCINPKSPQNLTCSGFGHCKCGNCICDPQPDIRYSGQFCELRLELGSGFGCGINLTREIESCVKCLGIDYKDYTQDSDRFSGCTSLCSKVNATLHLQSDFALQQDGYPSLGCKGSLAYEDCELPYFVIGKDIESNVVFLRTLKSPICDQRVSILAIFLYTTGVMILIGIGTILLWKFLTDFHDKREFAKFETEKRTAIWANRQNPLYRKTVSAFMNPAYGSDMDD